nr:MAG TPA: hypothetical protein [Caudoviricetes sp.]
MREPLGRSAPPMRGASTGGSFCLLIPDYLETHHG